MVGLIQRCLRTESRQAPDPAIGSSTLPAASSPFGRLS